MPGNATGGLADAKTDPELSVRRGSVWDWRVSAATAQDTVKVGLIVPLTGGQASTGKQLDNAVKLYMQQHGDSVAGKKIEVIVKDDGAVPDNTKRIAQELIVNDKVESSRASASRRPRLPQHPWRRKRRFPRS